MQDALVCPKCKSNLTKKNDNLSCGKCNLEYTINEGIYDFVDDSDSCVLELSIEEMDRLVNASRKNGWRDAVREIGFKYPYMNEIFLNNTKIDWLFHCLDLSKTSSCLELGSDWGTTAFCLAKYYDEVWSIDSVKQRLEFQRIRQIQDKIKNLKLGRASWFDLPFQENHFDLVAAKNYLDGIIFDMDSGKPRNVHLCFLKEALRVLKPGGCLYIGAPNRFKFSSFFREKNKMLNPLTNESIIKQFQILNYSFFGYKKILEEAGFKNIELYWTIDHTMPIFSGRLDGESFKYYLESIQKNSIDPRPFKYLLPFMMVHLPQTIIKYILTFASNSFLIFAYKEYKDTTFETKLLQLDVSSSSFLRRSGSRGDDSKIIYFLLKNGRPYCLYKFPRFKGFVTLASEEEKMSRFNQLDIKRKDVDSVIVFVEPFLEGGSIDYYDLSHNRAVLDWLLDFQEQTQQGYWEFKQLKVKVNNLIKFLSDIPIDDDIRLRTGEKLKSFLKILSEIKLPQNSEHGDFSPVNIIIDTDNKVYVSDWEFYNEKGDPLFDLVLFILSCCSAMKPFPQAFIDAFNGRGKYAPFLKILISEFCKAKQLPEELILQAVPYVLLRRIYRTTSEQDCKHFHFVHSTNLLELWDQIYPGQDAYLP